MWGTERNRTIEHPMGAKICTSRIPNEPLTAHKRDCPSQGFGKAAGITWHTRKKGLARRLASHGTPGSSREQNPWERECGVQSVDRLMSIPRVRRYVPVGVQTGR